jgi:S-adenosyl-L-methionine hydrolase (adenosine-forming)
MTVITLLTDFGLRDGYPGVMKGVIWKIAPQVQIADLSHSIKPQNIYSGALALSRTAPYFPDGTIHVAVVDPGVGTTRRPIGLRLGEHTYIGPDNGIFTLVIEKAESLHDTIQVVHLDNNAYWLPEISRVFHGRDIFAPVAAHLALGACLEQMGTQVDDPVRIDVPRPQSIPGGGLRGQVTEIDTFGNLITNIGQSQLLPLGEVRVHIAGEQIDSIMKTFGDRPTGVLAAFIGTSQDLVISAVDGNASAILSASIGDEVEVLPISLENP